MDKSTSNQEKTGQQPSDKERSSFVARIQALVFRDAKEQEYKYTPIPGTNHIRLIALSPSVPGEDRQRLVCRMHIVSLSKTPAYEALSYTWGGEERSETLICEGKTIRITKNLLDAFLQRGHSSEWRYFWADAVCINQEDIIERGQQISIMRSIYITASKVIVWLGHEKIPGEGLAAKAAAYQIVNECCIAARKRSPKYRSQALSPETIGTLTSFNSIVTGVDIEPDDPQAWLALASIYRQPWFSRVWVIQEVSANSNVTVRYGSEVIDWHHLVLASAWIQGNMHFEKEEFASFNWHGVSNAALMRELTEPTKLSKLSVLHLLGYTQWFEATDPRDKVYGLLGLYQWPTEGLNDRTDLSQWVYPNYALSVKDVYREVAVQSIKRSRTVKILSYVDHTTPDEDFPSWVPRWNHAPELRSPYMLQLRTPLENRRKPAYSATVRGDVLFIKGIIWSSVTHMSPPMTRDFFKHDFKSGSLPLAVIAGLCAQISLTIPSFPISSPYPNGDSLADAVMLALTFNQCLPWSESESANPQSDAVGNRELDQYRADFTAYQTSLLRNSHPDLTQYLSLAQQQVILTQLESLSIIEKAKGLKGDGERFRGLAAGTCRGRRTFVLKNGFVGLGPATMAPGDMVGILDGGGVFVLRPVPSGAYAGTNGWRVIGQSYVHGLDIDGVCNGTDVIDGKEMHQTLEIL
jgi:hypothetical protein